MISEGQLHEFAPHCDAATLAPILDEQLRRGEINTGLRVCHFLGQCSEETGGFTVFRENLHYSSAALLRVWPSHFTQAEAEACAMNPEAIALRAYSSRMDNGDASTGDAWRFIGRGALQTTGRGNYAALSALTGIDFIAHPDWLEQPLYAVQSAVDFWTSHHLNDVADRNDIEAVTRIVNGGLINLDHREVQFAAARAIWTDQAVAASLSGPVMPASPAPAPTPPPPPVAAPPQPVLVPTPPAPTPAPVVSAPKPTAASYDETAALMALGAAFVAGAVALFVRFWPWRKAAPKPSPTLVLQPVIQPQKALSMSDLSATISNFESLLSGKTDFNGFIGDEGALIEKNIASLTPALQPAIQLLYQSFKVGASSLVGAGLTAVGPILAQNTDVQASEVLNLLSLLGVPTRPPLNIAEQAVLVTAINGLKAGLDRVGIHIATSGQVSIAPSAPARAPQPEPVTG